MGNNELSLIELAVKVLEQRDTPININELIEEVLKLKNINDENKAYATKLYVDITTSSKFVFLGDGMWDLKSRQPLEVFDRDGAAFIKPEDEYKEPEEEKEFTEDFDEDEESDYDLDDDDEDEDDEDSDKDEDEDDEDDVIVEDEDYDEDELDEDKYDDDFEEDKYNKYMDDYEEMYEN